MTSLGRGAVSLYAAGAQNWRHFDRGIPRYVVEHLRAIHSLDPQLIASVLLNPGLPLTGNLTWLMGTGLLGWGGEDRRIASSAAGSPPPVYHVMSPFEPDTALQVTWPAWARNSSSVATVVTVYDLIPLVFSEHYLRDPRVRVEYETRLGLIRDADQVLAISESTANDAVHHLGLREDRVHVIHAGATETFGPMYSSKDAAQMALRDRLSRIRDGFALYVGGFEFRKNLPGMIAAYAKLPPGLRQRHQLVIACRMLPDQMQMLEQSAVELGIQRDELVLTGYVTDAELGALYHACTLFVFPSLYEGSGLPMLEAMSCGAPVAASATSTGPEVLGDREATFDPHDPEAMAQCLSAILTSPSTLDRLSDRSTRRAKTFTWQRVARETIEGYERAAVRVSARRRAHRPRIALVTPWPPERSGIADYNLRLATELGRRVDVDVVVGQPLDRYPKPLDYGVRLMQDRALEHLSWVRQHDRIVYCMGNSEFHRHCYELLANRPGAVVLHDVQLTGFYGWYAGVERPERPGQALAERIHATYGERLPADVYDGSAPAWDRQLALGIYMTREIQARAEQCFVHSRFSRDLLALDRGVLDRRAPISVLPFGMPETAASPRGPASESPLIVSLGYVSEVKGLATVISAFGQLLDVLPKAMLVIAGPAEPAELERWRRVADETGIGTSVEIPGHVDPDRYAELVRTADLAIQLRLVSNGEASAAVADCLANGVPTIVTDLGWASELPANAVEKLPVGAQPSALRDRMLTLLTEEPKRTRTSQAAIDHAARCSFSQVADAYVEALGLE